jgi:hypothetical protein
MLSKNNINEKDILKLQSFSRPPLKAGTYTLKSALINPGANLKGMPGKFDGQPVKITVEAPRFTLGLELFHSVYPLAGTTGDYQNTLPHIVLKRKTLPWERTADGDPNLGKPWLCLLLFSSTETDKYNVSEVKVKDFKSKDTNIKSPDIDLSNKERISDSKLKVIDVDLAFFKKIAPRLDELDFLVHNRQIDSSNRGNNDASGDGWSSALMCNRLPAKGKTNTVFMVSLEGCSDYLPSDNPETSTSSTGNKLRMAILRQWEFTDAGEKTEDILNRLNQSAKPLAIEFSGSGKASEDLQDIFKYGYTPINHSRRMSEKSVSWYRGPFIPLNVAHKGVRQYQNPDEALRFDQTTGMFDISYATAWQLGRLLALQDPNYSTAISNWKNAVKRDRPVEMAKDILKNKLPGGLNQLAAIINDVEEDEVFTDYLIELWNDSLKSKSKKK